MLKFDRCILLTNDTDLNSLKNLKEFFEVHYKKEFIVQKYDQSLFYEEQKVLYYLYLDDQSIKLFLENHKDSEINLSILPNKDAQKAMQRYGISKDIYEAIDDSLNTSLRVKDQILLCNGSMVFEKVSIGNVQNLSKKVFKTSTFENFKILIENLKNLRYQGMAYETAKGQKGQMVASGVLVLEDYTVYNTLKTSEKNSFHDGRLNAFFIAPASIISYIYYLLVIFFYHRFSIGNLSKSIGFVSTTKLQLNSSQALDFSLDESVLSAQGIQLEVYNTGFSVGYGKSFQQAINSVEQNNDSESVSVSSLPKGEMRDLLISGKVPFLKKASDDDLKETLIGIKQSAKVSFVFITLMVLSTLLATVGIYQDSTPSVIGAMILAPLMAPIISLAMGMVRSDRHITKNSMNTLGLGILSALFFSSLLTVFIPLDMVTSQMSSRINPNLLDLFVAVFSGIAGAYASAKEEVAKSLAGVAIAVALVPPLCVTGVGIGWMNLDMIYGSFLLFLTNLFGVTLAASVTFIVMGYAPIHRAKKGLVLPFVLLAVVSIPLVLSFYSLILQSNDYTKLHYLKELELSGKTVYLSSKNIKSSTNEETLLECEVSSSSPLTDTQYKQLQEKLSTLLGKRVKLEVISKIIVE